MLYSQSGSLLNEPCVLLLCMQYFPAASSAILVEGDPDGGYLSQAVAKRCDTTQLWLNSNMKSLVSSSDSALGHRRRTRRRKKYISIRPSHSGTRPSSLRIRLHS